MLQDFQKILFTSLTKLGWHHLRNNLVVLMMVLAALVATMVTGIRYVLGVTYALDLGISFWLWMTVWLSNLIESVVDYKGKSRLAKLQPTYSKSYVQRISKNSVPEVIPLDQLIPGDTIIVGEGMLVPVDGRITEGAARVDESMFSGEVQTVVRNVEDDYEVKAGSKVVSGTIQIQVIRTNIAEDDAFTKDLMRNQSLSSLSSEYFLENLLAVYSISLVAAVGILGVILDQVGTPLSLNVLLAFWVCLAPTTVSALLPSISLIGMLHLLKQRVIILSSKAVEVAGEVESVFFDKTGTVTYGYLHAIRVYPVTVSSTERLMRLIVLTMQKDVSAEASSATMYAKRWLDRYYSNRPDKLQEALTVPISARYIPLNSSTRLAGVDIDNEQLRWGSLKDIQSFCSVGYAAASDKIQSLVQAIVNTGDSVIMIANQTDVYGIIQLHDYVKKDLTEISQKLTRVGVNSSLISGDNALTVASVAHSLDLTEYVAAASAEVKMRKIRDKQQQGYVVAMVGDGQNDISALKQADLAVVMSTGSMESKQWADMIDLDSTPNKLLHIIRIGRQMLLAKGALTTFSLINDAVKCIVILPAILMHLYPNLSFLNFLKLKSMSSAILSALTFNALIIPCSLPLAFWGVRKASTSVSRLLKQNIGYFGVCGILLPVICIKLLDCWY